MSIKRNVDAADHDAALGDINQIDQERELAFRTEGHDIVLRQLEWIYCRDKGMRPYDPVDYDHPLHLFDCAVGLGEFLERLEGDPRFRCWGVDIDPTCVAEAREHARRRRPWQRKTVPSAQIWTGDAADAGGAVPHDMDVVVATALLEHVENPHALLSEIHRVSCRWALIMTPNALRPAKIWAAMRRDLRWERSGHLQAWDYHLFVQQLQYHGFKVHRVDVRFVDFPWGHKRFPRLVRWMSYKVLPRLFPWLGSEMFALCEKVER